MTTPIFNYPLDLTGTAQSNRVVNEEYVIGAVRARLFIAKGGPFFGNTVELTDLETGRPLVPVQDFLLIHRYEEAEQRTKQPVYAGVRIVNPMVSSRIGFTRSHVGGEFSYSYYALAEAVIALLNDNRTINWGDLVGVPSQWNPAPHLHPIRNAYGWKAVVDSIMMVEKAVREGDEASRSLLLETIEHKLTLLDQFRDDMNSQFDAFKDEIRNSALNFGEMLDEFRDNLPLYTKPLQTKGGVYEIGSLNQQVVIFPTSPTVVAWSTNVRLLEELEPEDGDWVELIPSRDGGVVNIYATDHPIRMIQIVNGVDQIAILNSLEGLPLDRAGIRLTWDSRVGAFDLSRRIDPKTVRFDQYSLNEAVTTGAMDLNVSNSFVLADSAATRVVTFTNIPLIRAFTVVVRVVGDRSVIWPLISWMEGEAPELSPTGIIVVLYRTGQSWVGSWRTIDVEVIENPGDIDPPEPGINLGLFYGGTGGIGDKVTRITAQATLYKTETTVGTQRPSLAGAPCGVNALFYGGGTSVAPLNRATVISPYGGLVGAELSVGPARLAHVGGIHDGVSLFHSGVGTAAIQNSLSRFNNVATYLNEITFVSSAAKSQHAAANMASSMMCWGLNPWNSQSSLLGFNGAGTVIHRTDNIGVGRERSAGASASGIAIFNGGDVNNTSNRCTTFSDTFTVLQSNIAVGITRMDHGSASIANNAMFYNGASSVTPTNANATIMNSALTILFTNTFIGTVRSSVSGCGVTT